MVISTLLIAHGLLQSGSTEVTVYNQGLGFIKEVRNVNLAKGTQNVVVENIAQQIDASSVGFKCLSNPGSVSVLEQNYQYDLISPDAILAKSVGKKIRLTRSMGGKKELVEGVLISSPTAVVNTGNGSEHQYNGLVIRTDDGRIILSPQGEIDVLELPEGLISKPSLLWQVDSAQAQDAKMELSYLTKGMSWSANYVLTLNENSLGDLQGWVTLDNQCGVSFKDATLKLLAGEVNVVREQQQISDGLTLNAPASLPLGVSRKMVENSLFEYHLYTLMRLATIKNKESKQLGLLEGFNVPIRKVLSFDGWVNGNPTPADESANVQVKFVNSEKNHLGMPMPAGKIRLYQRDAKGSVQFLGEDSINHTPRDEKLSLGVGRSFDIKRTRKQTAYTKVSKTTVRSSFEMELRNRKNESATVYLYEHQRGNWKVTAKSQDFTKEDSSTIVFEVKLKPNEVKKVAYTVESEW